MRRLLVPLAVVALACCAGDDPADSSHEWLHVLRHKKAALAPNATPQQKQAVAQDLYKILATANKPSQQSVQAFANDLTAYLADGKITTAEAMRLTQDMQAVLASANISQQDAQKLMRDVQTLLKATNLTQADAQTLQRDVQAIVTTAQQGHPKKK